tara:strand:+ start:147 stop:299 length:153 start_codon:yes stop_codon:yes gene_type:complete
MLSTAQSNVLYILKDEKELLMTRTDKEDIEYLMVLRWLQTKIRELEIQND